MIRRLLVVQYTALRQSDQCCRKEAWSGLNSGRGLGVPKALVLATRVGLSPASATIQTQNDEPLATRTVANGSYLCRSVSSASVARA
jgi:hypothetical protein